MWPIPPFLRHLGRLAGPALVGLLATMALPLRADPQGPSLAGTTWRLVEIRSMDDAQGVTRPRDPARYTLWLQVNGRASLQLDCNRGTGRRTAAPSADPVSGSFRFGPIATTRALCPPPSLGKSLGSRLAEVRGYLLKEDRLFLSLMADGGILVWEPLEGGGLAFSARPDPALEAAILRSAPSYRRSVLAAAGGGPTRARYVHARTDLDGDGRDEVFVYLMGPYFCGTGGCSLQLFRATGQGYALVNDFPISRVPVVVADRRTRGWRDLWRLQSGGGAPPTYVRQVFDGRRYVERERIPAEKGTMPKGLPVLTGEPGFDQGAVLEPRR